MDLGLFKRDIDELIGEFAAAESIHDHSRLPESSLSRRLGGLYCRYETQPFKPPFKVYISLEELKKLRKLVVDAKVRDVNVVSALVKRMLDKNAFLFGCVETNEGLKGKVDELTELENARIQAACKQLFADTRIEEFIHMDLGVELDLSKLKQMSSDYAQLKKIAAREDGEQEMKGVSKDKELKLHEEEQQRQEEELGDDENFDKELEQMLSET
ncbi:hypothetical protein M0R45_035632 [Rubus argutus]|uniref:Uncharacterized protein n=1 Tax=Rubus argutus TaxID=59490 RepID=A0AAW1VZ28_RUBAR